MKKGIYIILLFMCCIEYPSNSTYKNECMLIESIETSNGVKNSWITYVYDSNNNNIRTINHAVTLDTGYFNWKVHVYNDGNIITDTFRDSFNIYSITKYKYNSLGDTISIVVESIAKDLDTIYWKTFEYDSENRLIRESFQGDPALGVSNTLYYYDNNSNCIKIEYNGANNEIIENTFNSDGKLISCITTIPNNPGFSINTVYKYDNNELYAKISVSKYNEDTFDSINISYTYDSNNRLINELTIDITDKWIDSIFVNYQYDDYGNLINTSKYIDDSLFNSLTNTYECN
jgi:hypothetical protein